MPEPAELIISSVLVKGLLRTTRVLLGLVHRAEVGRAQ
jgi:hypothetical protein